MPQFVFQAPFWQQFLLPLTLQSAPTCEPIQVDACALCV